jgi:glyoxylase-like metal-dependent hydrolase (beta-lactamase superfamily II)
MGQSIQNIERIILTHGHVDHRELAARLGKESGAEIMFHSLEEAKVVRHPAKEEISRLERIDMFKSMGVPIEDVPDLVDSWKTTMVDAEAVATTMVGDGDDIKCDDFTLKVLHTPGHSCGSLCLYEKSSGILFSGDTILSGSHVNALLEMDMISRNPGYNGLKLHIESLERLVDLNPTYVLPGHGEIFTDLPGVVNALIKRHTTRRRHILRSLRSGPRSLYQICKSTFLFESSDALFLMLSEALWNVEILIEEGKVIKDNSRDVVFYQKA